MTVGTSEGESALLELIRDALGRPPHDVRSDLALAAVWIDLLPPQEALLRLDRARAAVQAAFDQREYGRKAKQYLPPIAAALFDNAQAILDADLRLLQRMADFIEEEISREA